MMILLFTVFINIVGTQDIRKSLPDGYDDYLVELDRDSFFDSIALKKCFVLFYTEDSKVCSLMSYNLNNIAKTNQGKTNFYKVDLSKYPEYDLKYNISGVPNIFIFDDGEEVNRIMGVVPEHNLKIIFDKTIKQQ